MLFAGMVKNVSGLLELSFPVWSQPTPMFCVTPLKLPKVTSERKKVPLFPCRFPAAGMRKALSAVSYSMTFGRMRPGRRALFTLCVVTLRPVLWPRRRCTASATVRGAPSGVAMRVSVASSAKAETARRESRSAGRALAFIARVYCNDARACRAVARSSP